MSLLKRISRSPQEEEQGTATSFIATQAVLFFFFSASDENKWSNKLDFDVPAKTVCLNLDFKH